jgi:hypothetical protein
MTGYGSGQFGGGGFGEAASVEVDIYTSAYRVTGTIATRFTRVSEVLNQLTTGHLDVARATISEHADPSATLGAPSTLVAVDEILLMVAAGMSGGGGEMRIQKRPVRAQLAIPPFRVTGTIHVPMGSRPIEGLLHGVEAFMVMTDATIASGPYPQLERAAPVVALRRGRAHVLLVADDENPDQLLAEVLDERTAEAWLHPEEEGGGG